MAGLYIGSTGGFAGKNMIALSLGLKLQKDGHRIGYMKPVGAVPSKTGERSGDDDAFFLQGVLGLEGDPELVTPVLVTQDFKVKAFAGDCPGLIDTIKQAYATLSKDREVMIVGGSGSFLFSGKYCGVDGANVSAALDLKVLLIDRYHTDLNYDYLLRAREVLGDRLIGAVLNDIPEAAANDVQSIMVPLLERHGIAVLGMIPRDPLMSAIKVGDLAERLGGKIISVHNKSERVVENFLIGTMQVENFMTHFRRQKNSAIIVGGDRSDVQLVALEGKCPCLVLTGNLYPNDIILTRSEVLEIPIIVVRDDTYTVAKKMETILSSIKLRDIVKIKHGAQLVNSSVDMNAIKESLELT